MLTILYIKLMKSVMLKLFMKSANILPMSGIKRKALTEGPYLSVKTCIFAMAFGVAPMPKPQLPAVSTAAS